MPHLFAVDGGKYPAVFEVTIYLVFFDAFADDAAALEGHFTKQLGLRLTDSAFYHIEIAAVAVDYLATVAARGAPATLAASNTTTLKPASNRCSAELSPV